jgi:hypothetical protein
MHKGQRIIKPTFNFLSLQFRQPNRDLRLLSRLFSIAGAESIVDLHRRRRSAADVGMFTIRAQGLIRCQAEGRSNEVSQIAFWHFREHASLSPVTISVSCGRSGRCPGPGSVEPHFAYTRIETLMIGRHWLHKRLRLIPTSMMLECLLCGSAAIIPGIDKCNPHIRSSFHNYLDSE